MTRLRHEVGHQKVVEFLDLARRAGSDKDLRIRRIDEAPWVEAAAIFRKFGGPCLSFTDCTAFAILRERPADEVFGYDAPSEMMGHILQPKG